MNGKFSFPAFLNRAALPSFAISRVISNDNLQSAIMVYRALSVFLIGNAIGFASEPLFPNADFETGTLQGWTVEGDAFAHHPTMGDNPSARGRESSLHEGEYWIGGFERYDGRAGQPGDTLGDAATGTLTSPEFTIAKPYITFLIGGGRIPGEVGVKLLCDGREVELATGANSESMIPSSHDVSKFIGKKARLVIFDNATEGWGHVNVDSFAAADQPRPDTSQDFAFNSSISRSAYPETGYDQPLRPQFHFTSRRNWLNDPNGMVYDGQRYHLFFQHNPLAPVWGNMTWGHATSQDMVHWTQREHALLPYRVDGRAGSIFSGTAVVDHNNSLGVQVGDTKTLCAFFTFAAQPKFYQAMAYTTDGGDTWTYWNEGRPVIPNQGFDSGERDPKVFWHEASQQWVMLLWVQQNPGRVRIFTSSNLVDWTFASDLMRDWAFECMDIAFLPVDGDKTNVKALIYDASFDYEIGTFDGKTFHTEAGPFQAGGGNFYAAQTFNNSPDGRTVQIGWMRGGPNVAEKYGLPFNQQMSFPCELNLRTTESGVRVFAWPVKEINTLVKRTHDRKEVILQEGGNLLEGMEKFDLVDLEIDFDPGSARQVIFNLSGVTLTYDAATRTLSQRGVDDNGDVATVPVFNDLRRRDGSIQLRVLIDRLSVESYTFGGEQFRANYYAPDPHADEPSITTVGGKARIKHLTVRELDSAWGS